MNDASKTHEIYIVCEEIENLESQNEALRNYVEELKASSFRVILCQDCPHSTYFVYDGIDLKLYDRHSGQSLKLDWGRELKIHLSRKYGLTKEPLFRALKLKGDSFESNYLVDASLGTGKDACLLLSFKCHLLCFERNPFVFALALWAYQRACEFEDTAIASIFINHMGLVFGEALTYDDPQHKYQKCFFDPMYETKAKSALSRKEMEVFKHLVGKDEDQHDYLAQLIEKFSFVCLKRPIKAAKAQLASKKYQMVSFSGKSTRYDRYFMP